MTTNIFYNADGNPPAQTRGTSASIRNEFLMIQAGFANLPISAYAADTGAANAYVVSVNPNITAYTDGLQVVFKASHANTAASTLNVNGLGATNILHADGTPLQIGDILVGQFVAATYNITTGQFSLVTAAMGEILATITSQVAASQATLTAQINAAAFQAALPAQAGNAGKIVTTNGATASWGASSLPRSPRTANAILTAADQATFVDITSGTFAQTFTAQATLGAGWYAILRNSGTGNITLTPAGNLIDGLASYVMYPQECRLIQCDGTNFNSIILHPYSATYTTSGTHITPPGYSYHGGLAWSAGSSGQRTNSVTTGSVGGGGGGCIPFNFTSAQLGASQTITIGAGGAAVTTVAVGNYGGNTSIGSILTVYGSGVVVQGTGSWYVGGGPLSIFNGNGQSTSLLNTPGVGFIPTLGTNNAGAYWGGDYGGGYSAQNAASPSGNTGYGGAGGGSVSSSAVVQSAGTSFFGGNGGAAASAANGTAGTAPGGGGGATQTGASSGAGARGEVRIWGIV